MQEHSSIIRCENVTLGYDKDIILQHVNLDIIRGDFLPFVGPNGGGKSTLLKGILGLLKPMAGKIQTPFSTNPAGYVPQQLSFDSLFPMTAVEIIKMGFYPKLGWWKKPNEDHQKVLCDALRELNLDGHAHKNFRDLSGGTKQKVLIARALVSGAEVFIMDEPTAELDVDSENEVLRHLWRFVEEQEKTVLFAYHGLSRLEIPFKRVCLVDHGKAKLLSIDKWREYA